VPGSPDKPRVRAALEHVELAVVTGASMFGVILLLGSFPFVLLLGVLHMACRKVGSQAVHVGVAGGIGFVGGLAMRAVILQLDGYSPVLSAAVLALTFAVGRAALIPLVLRRRRQLVVKPAWG
jgi:hypothetical protein